MSPSITTMQTKNSRRFLTIVTSCLALTVGSSLLANTLLPGSSVSLTNVFGVYGTEVASEYQDLSAGPITGKVGVKVLTDVADNPFAGGLTFVYEIQNTSQDLPYPFPGITYFEVSGWQGFQTFVARSNQDYFFSPSGSPVMPGPASRSADGNTITFSFPPDNPGGGGEPPIFGNEYGRQLIVFTDATIWQGITGYVTTEDFESPSNSLGNPQTMTVSTLTAGSAVPDGGSSSLLLALGALGLFAAHHRRKLSR